MANKVYEIHTIENLVDAAVDSGNTTDLMACLGQYIEVAVPLKKNLSLIPGFSTPGFKWTDDGENVSRGEEIKMEE